MNGKTETQTLWLRERWGGVSPFLSCSILPDPGHVRNYYMSGACTDTQAYVSCDDAGICQVTGARQTGPQRIFPRLHGMGPGEIPVNLSERRVDGGG